MAINATYSFTPSIAGGSIAVSNKANETEVKNAVLAVLAQRKAAAQGDVSGLENAENQMNG